MSEHGKLAIAGLVGFIGAVLLLGTIALFFGGSVQAEKTASGMSFRVIGFQHVSLKNALDEAWQKDPATTRSLLLSWGRNQGIVDAKDFGQLEDTLQRYHAKRWYEISKLAARLQSKEKVNSFDVEIGYAGTGTISSRTLYFKGGDDRFTNLSNPDCKVEIGRASIMERIGVGGILTGKADVQIPLNDLIDLYARRYGLESLPPTSSKAYDAIRHEVQKLGVIHGKVYLQ